jgi:hypothetical protein
MYVYTTVYNNGKSNLGGLDGMTVWDESWDAKIWTHLTVMLNTYVFFHIELTHISKSGAYGMN